MGPEIDARKGRDEKISTRMTGITRHHESV
jgi:hypothetical protein